MRIFLSFNSKDLALAESLRSGLSRLEPDAAVFFSPDSLGSGLWLPKLADEIAGADAFLLLIGPQGIGNWQKVEYFTAFDRHVSEASFALVPVIAAGAQVPGLSFLRSLNWVEAPILTEDQALHQIIAALKGDKPATATPLWKLVHPYRGLEAMNEANADYFYGRTAETAAVLDALATKPDRLPMLVGASGAGKSSVAQAGVLSALKAMRWPGADARASAQWPAGLANSRTLVTLAMRPGVAPLEALAGAFIATWGLDTRDPENAALPRKWARGLFAGDNTLADLIGASQEQLRRREGTAPDRVLLYLDQGEELYIRAAPPDARRFSKVLADGLSDGRFLALGSLRADYFDRFQADQALFDRHEHINVAPLNRAQLELVVTEPPRALGVAFESDRIPGAITDAAAAKPGALPLLSYLLTDMWADMVNRGTPVLSLPAQAIDIGGVLAKRADAFLRENPGEEKALRRLLTLRLAVVPAEGEAVRRQTHREECTEAEWLLATRLADYPYRLVVMGERDAQGQIVAEVAHEAFLHAWPVLVQWLREERGFLVFKGEAERAERRWRELGQADRALLTGLDLARAEELLPARSEDLPADVTAYLQRSIAFDRAAKEEQLRLQIKVRQLQMQRRMTVGFGAAALLMAILGSLALVQWRSAQQQDQRATAALAEALQQKQSAAAALAAAQTDQSRFLAELARQQLIAGDAGTALLLALEGLPTSSVNLRPYVPEAGAQLDEASRALRERMILIGHAGSVTTAAFSLDGTRIVTASFDGTARQWNAATGALLVKLAGHADRVWTAAFSADGKRIVTASADNTARVWDAATGQLLVTLAGHTDAVYSAAFSPDGARIVTASADRTARLWDAATGKQIARLLGHTGVVYSASFSPDGARIVSSSKDKTARLWDAATGAAIGVTFAGHTDAVWTAAFSPDGKRIVTASADRTARVWDAGTGQLLITLTGHTDGVNSAAFSPDGARIVTASNDKTVRLWDAVSGKQIGRALAAGYQMGHAAFSPDGKRIVTASNDDTARVWDTESAGPAGVLGPESASVSAAFSPDGKRIVTGSRLVATAYTRNENETGSSDNVARLWDAATGKEIGTPLTGHRGTVWSAAFSTDGTRIVTASADKTARLWDAATGEPIGQPFAGHIGAVTAASFSRDGARIVTGSDDSTAGVWDAGTGKELIKVDTGAPVSSAVFSPDGKQMLTASGKSAGLWDAATGKQIWQLTGGTFDDAAFSPDGKRIVTAGAESVQIRDVSTGAPIGAPLLGHTGEVVSAEFSPDGTRLLTASKDQTARIWDAATGRQIGELDQENELRGASFRPDGKRIVTASVLQAARLWDVLTTQQVLADAMAAIPRCLTAEQRQAFFVSAAPPDWCVEMKKWPYQTAAWQQWLADTRAGKNPPLPSGP